VKQQMAKHRPLSLPLLSRSNHWRRNQQRGFSTGEEILAQGAAKKGPSHFPDQQHEVTPI